MVSLSSTTVREIRQVMEMEMKPKWKLDILLREVKLGVKQQNKVGQKDLLEQCARRKVYPVEILSLAKKIRSGKDDRNKVEEIRIIRVRIR